MSDRWLDRTGLGTGRPVKDRHAQLLSALRALADVPEAETPGALEFWLAELARLTGFAATPLDARRSRFYIIAADGRRWDDVTLRDVIRIVEREPEA